MVIDTQGSEMIAHKFLEIHQVVGIELVRISLVGMVASQGKLQLAEGKWIVIYPEGTRTRAGSFTPYRKGGVRLALATETNILPVAQNSGRFWPRNSILKRPGVITVSIGSVIEVAGKNEVELQHELETVIESEMHQLDPHSYHH